MSMRNWRLKGENRGTLGLISRCPGLVKVYCFFLLFSFLSSRKCAAARQVREEVPRSTRRGRALYTCFSFLSFLFSFFFFRHDTFDLLPVL
ncbi:uncharacterized protein F4812DRAFT_115308 [Daldinia caldariorum]|uniref:uncharacterized protein n=1 Tax=Daldinia caldariorum TaxID=326644 RepID=UPI0020089A1C|nr:uncharacterized protein F4812DRAFT_115308 [Daldinia caldariorum]KAI1465872.1 hypothetical protein F4812DRAFT_115308 [Daldinia caldariorum]